MADDGVWSGLNAWLAPGKQEYRDRLFRANAGAHYLSGMQSSVRGIDRVHAEDLQDILYSICCARDQGARVLILIRGTPGTGKSTLGELLQCALEGSYPSEGVVIKVEADDFMTVCLSDNFTHTYHFDGNRLGECHRHAQDVARAFLSPTLAPTVAGMNRWFTQNGHYNKQCLIVANTFVNQQAMEPYHEMVQERTAAGEDPPPRIITIDLNSLFWARGVPSQLLEMDRRQGDQYIVGRMSELRNSHGVPPGTISRMLASYKRQCYYLMVRIWVPAKGAFSITEACRGRSAQNAWCEKWPEYYGPYAL
ncbi:hypothetical protein B484DRAFT_472566 [Ochromonadaceae sp. CCMP2298]|nr:hypothetical protein B484DRAFT_472566 [Ochromonadaceae sp. CCMP2298]